jgi:pyruvate,water dikinase
MIYAEKAKYFLWTYHHKYPTTVEKQNQFSLNDKEVIQLSQWCYKIEKHYKKPIYWNGQKTG